MEPMSLGHLAVWRHTPSNGSPKARVLLIHGICEHSGRHLPTVETLSAAGMEVVRFDLRGSGASGGRRQFVDKFEDYVADVVKVYNWISSDLEPLPLFVYGHSMGGAIAIHFASQYSALFHGLILTAPGYLTGSGISPLKIAVGRVVCKFLPTMRIAAGNPENLSRDPEVVEAYRNDPLSSHFNTLRQGEVVLDAFKEIPARCKQIRNPVLIAHGSSDKVIMPSGSFEVLQALASPSKELHYLPGVYHEPHLDFEKEKYFALLTRWVEQHTPARRASDYSRQNAIAART
jgi:acylglycerol lipase